MIVHDHRTRAIVTRSPQDLITDGLFKMVALELLPAPHNVISAVHLANALGASVKAPLNTPIDLADAPTKVGKARANAVEAARSIGRLTKKARSPAQYYRESEAASKGADEKATDAASTSTIGKAGASMRV